MSRKTSGRHPTAYERTLWEKIVSNATPLARPRVTPDDITGNTGSKRTELAPEAVRTGTRLPDDFRLGKLSRSLPPVQELAPDPTQDARHPRMDPKQHGRLTRGKLKPEARLDLHGMTLSAALPALISFIKGAHRDGKRLVLVITGKGRERSDGGPIPTPTGVLRHHVPGWLRSGHLSAVVLDIATAHRRHGGSGAYYVYLRRRR